VQDATGGLDVFGISTSAIPLGTLVRVTGIVGQYEGDSQIHVLSESDDILMIDSTPALVSPLSMSTGASMLETSEGWLVKVEGVVTSIVTTGGDNSIYVDDGTGVAKVYVNGYVGDGTDNPAMLGAWDPAITVGDWVSAIGLASQDAAGHRLRVRNTAEIVRASRASYTLAYTAGVGGSITGASPQTVNQGAGGTTVTATPNGGYHFVSWSDGILTTARTDINVTANINATATFAIDININTYAYTLTVTKVGNGTVTLVPAGGTYNYGTVVTLTATPAAGWHFVGWSGSLTGVTNSATITMDASKTITATYVRVVSYPVLTQHIMVLTIGSKTVIVDGVRVVLDVSAAIFEDRTFVPMRALVEHLGGTIAWNAKTRQVTIEVRGTTIVFTIGKAMALVNGKSLAIDPKNNKVVPVIVSGRSMLPLRFVAENLGFQIVWNAKARTVTLTWGA